MPRERLTNAERRLIANIAATSDEHERVTNNDWTRQRRQDDPAYAEHLREIARTFRQRQREDNSHD